MKKAGNTPPDIHEFRRGGVGSAMRRLTFLGVGKAPLTLESGHRAVLHFEMARQLFTGLVADPTNRIQIVAGSLGRIIGHEPRVDSALGAKYFAAGVEDADVKEHAAIWLRHSAPDGVVAVAEIKTAALLAQLSIGDTSGSLDIVESQTAAAGLLIATYPHTGDMSFVNLE